MATKIYDIHEFTLVDGTVVQAIPLKIKYLREFMEKFENVKHSKDDEEAIIKLVDCAVVCMKQYYPKITTSEELEDNIDLPTVYRIIDIAAGIKIKDEEKEVKKQATDSGSSWDKLDLAKLEAELFLLGIWKDYEDLELSLSMPELISTLEAKRDFDYQNKKFMAAIQGVDIDKDSDKSNAWEEMKARVFSDGKAANSNDVLALQGINAQKAGFGIGMGLGYEDLTKKSK